MIALLEFELDYYDIVVQYVSNNAPGTPLSNVLPRKLQLVAQWHHLKEQVFRHKILFSHVATNNRHFCELSNIVDKFTYLGSIVSSTETDFNTRLAKAWTAIDRLSVIWKSDLTYKIKLSFFPSSGRVDTAIWMHYMDANWMYEEKAWRQLHKNDCEQY